MNRPTKTYSLGEEIFNSVSHGIGGLLAIAGTVVIIVMSAIYSTAAGVVSASVYGATLIILYTMSTLYHAISNPTAKKFFRIMDHNTIFLLIAGSYTPFTLVTFRAVSPALGWTLFGVVWGIAAIGIVLNSINLEKFKKPSVICYILLGWIILVAIKPLLESDISVTALVLLASGGVVYTLGVIFYALKKIKWFHSVWHLFTIAGSVLQYFAILFTLIGK